ncbi:MAG: hypothetical protein QM661_14990 [Solimonas sp.]
MKLNEFRLRMEAYRQDADREAMVMKDSHLALERLHAMYKKFDSEERKMADQVIAEWVLSKDEKLRFDALVLIDDFKISGTVSALRDLAKRLPLSSTPGAPYELRKVNRILDGLTH